MDPKSSVKYPVADKNGVLGNLVSELPPKHFIRVALLSPFLATDFYFKCGFSKCVFMGPKSYIYDVVSEEDPFGQPVQTEIRLKGG